MQPQSRPQTSGAAELNSNNKLRKCKHAILQFFFQKELKRKIEDKHV